MSYYFHYEAEKELSQTVAYYEDIHPGLGLDFATEVYSTTQRIVSFPTAWTKLGDDVRRCMVNRFPYGVLYREEGEQIQILAVMNLNQKPGYWKARLEK